MGKSSGSSTHHRSDSSRLEGRSRSTSHAEKHSHSQPHSHSDSRSTERTLQRHNQLSHPQQHDKEDVGSSGRSSHRDKREDSGRSDWDEGYGSEKEFGRERWSRSGRGFNEQPTSSADPRSLARWGHAPSPPRRSKPSHWSTKTSSLLPPAAPSRPRGNYRLAYLKPEQWRQGENVYSLLNLRRRDEWQQEEVVRELIDEVFIEQIEHMSVLSS